MRSRLSLWRWLPALATIAVGALLFFLPPNAPFLQAAEGRTLDWRFQVRGPMPPEGAVITILIDDRSVEAAGGWPLPREMLANAVQALRRAGANVIAFDLLLADRRGAGDEALVRTFGVGDDVVIPFAFVFDGEPAQDVPRPLEAEAVEVHHGTDTGPRPASVVTPFPALAESAAMGHAAVIVDVDNRLRYLHVAIAYLQDLYPALPVVIARRHVAPGTGLVVSARTGLHLGGHSFPLDPGLRLPIDFYGPAGSLPARSLADLLAGEVPDSAIDGKVAIIGVRATGLGDVFATPFGPGVPGVEILASATENLIAGRTLRRDVTTRLASLAALVLGSLSLALIAALARAWLALAGVTGMLAIWFAGLQFAFETAGWWIDAALPTATMLAAVAAAALPRAVSAESARRRLSRYVPTGFAEALGQGTPIFGRKQRPASILFVDMRGFTALSESVGPAHSADLLERFYAVVEAVVDENGGAVTSYLGDGAMAVFGMAASSSDDPVRALVCARRLTERLVLWARDADGPEAWSRRFGIGVHHGPVVIRPLGGGRRFQLTATGDAVNVASRLQALTAGLGATVVISAEVAQVVGAAGRQDLLSGFLRLDNQAVRGRREPLDLLFLPERVVGEASSASD